MKYKGKIKIKVTTSRTSQSDPYERGHLTSHDVFYIDVRVRNGNPISVGPSRMLGLI